MDCKLPKRIIYLVLIVSLIVNAILMASVFKSPAPEEGALESEETNEGHANEIDSSSDAMLHDFAGALNDTNKQPPSRLKRHSASDEPRKSHRKNNPSGSRFSTKKVGRNKKEEITPDPEKHGHSRYSRYRLKTMYNWFLSVTPDHVKGVREHEEASKFEYGKPVTHCANDDSSDCETFLRFVDLKSQRYLCMHENGTLYSTKNKLKAQKTLRNDCLFEKISVGTYSDNEPIFIFASAFHPSGHKRHICRRINKGDKKNKKVSMCRLLTFRTYICLGRDTGIVHTRRQRNIKKRCMFREFYDKNEMVPSG